MIQALTEVISCNYGKAIQLLGLEEFTDINDVVIICNQLFNNVFFKKVVSDGTGKTTMDHIKDYPYIYASFKKVYNIDLSTDKLTFVNYLYLLDGLFLASDNPIQRVVDIRTMELPKDTGDNFDYRNSILSLKLQYKLDDDNEKVDTNAFRSLFSLARSNKNG